MILLLGQTGYIGSAFAAQMSKLGLNWRSSPHGQCLDFIKSTPGISLVVNCAAFIPVESVALCDQNREETLRANLILPTRISQICEQREIPLAHLSTGYLWKDGQDHSELDAPQNPFDGRLGFYIGSKVLAEEEVRKHPQHYIWRLSLAFDHVDHPRNYLSKLLKYPQVFDCENTISHRGDFVKSCLDLWQAHAPYGTYNVMNPGNVKATYILQRMVYHGILLRKPEMSADPFEDSKASVQKLLAAGICIRSAQEALEDSLSNWIGL